MKAPRRAMRLTDVSGQKFGRLNVAWPIGYKQRGVAWLCFCDCGNMVHVRTADLLRKHTVSCGCYNRERDKTHGRTGTSEWNTYRDAKNRCTNPRHHAYKDYGGRGIKFLFTSFEQFFDLLGERPFKLQLDRIDNDGHYEPTNVKWSTCSEQSKNKRNPWITRRKNMEMKCLNRK